MFAGLSNGGAVQSGPRLGDCRRVAIAVLGYSGNVIRTSILGDLRIVIIAAMVVIIIMMATIATLSDCSRAGVGTVQLPNDCIIRFARLGNGSSRIRALLLEGCGV